MDRQRLVAVACELGVSPQQVDQLRGLPVEKAVSELEQLKQTARANYKKLAFKYHPDRNPGNPEAEEIFKVLTPILKEIESLQVRSIPRPVPVRLHVQFVRGVNTQTGSVSWAHFSSSSSTTTTTAAPYNVHHVVNMRSG